MSRRVALFSSLAVLALPLAATADITLSATMTVDNEFTASLSTNPFAPGATFLTGNNWPSTPTGSVVLPGPGTYYLQIQAVDTGVPAMFIGEFGLSGGSATFSNGGTSLLTNTANWVVSNTGFGVAPVAPQDLGPNGTGPWGFFGSINAAARFLWSPNYTPTVYFTTVITVVPAPGASAALGLGALVLARRRRR